MSNKTKVNYDSVSVKTDEHGMYVEFHFYKGKNARKLLDYVETNKPHVEFDFGYRFLPKIEQSDERKRYLYLGFRTTRQEFEEIIGDVV